MKTLIGVMSDKGGVGKTHIASLLSQYFAARGVSHALVDADSEVSSLTVWHGARAIRVARDLVDAQGRRQFDSLYELLAENPTVVADLPAGSVQDFVAWASSAGVIDAAEADGVRIVLAVPVTGADETVRGAAELAEAFTDRVSWLVFAGHYAGDPTLWQGSKTRAKLMGYGAAEIAVDALMPALAQSVRSAPCTMTELIVQKKLPTLMAGRLRRWLDGIFTQLDAVEFLPRAAAPSKKEARK